MENNKYRLDIQGLRAIAVMCVVIFHIAPEYLPGGFIGVDMFFVISGYLIIGHIAKDLKNNSFSLLTFYSKRVARLFPAYFILMIFCFVFSYFLLLPSEFSNYVSSAITSIFYVSNIWFFTQSGYFDNALQMSPLLHTWSLSVEEQFYIIFPLLLFWLYKKSEFKVLISLVFIAILSLLFSEFYLNENTSMVFFLSPFRFWQFIVGGLLAITYIQYPKKALATITGVVGLIIILICLFIFNEHTAFPGFNAIAPTLATVLLIYSGVNNTTITYRLLCLPISIFFGNISYSFYLWHWPIIIFYKYSVDYTLVKYHMLIVFFLSVLFGFISYKYIENPTRKLHKKFTSIFIIIGSLLLSISLCLFMFFSINLQSSGLSIQKKTFASYLEYDPAEEQRLGQCFITSLYNDVAYFDKKNCVEIDENKENIVLIGDSHAAHWYSSLREVISSEQTLTQINASGCKPTVAYEGLNRCTELVRWAYEELLLSGQVDTIILSARWTNRDIESLKKTVDFLQNYSKRVVVLGPIIEYEQALPRLLSVYGEDNAHSYSKYKKIKTYDEELAVALSEKHVDYISIIDSICENDHLCISAIDNEIPLQFDYGHLTERGANLLMDRIKIKILE